MAQDAFSWNGRYPLFTLLTRADECPSHELRQTQTPPQPQVLHTPCPVAGREDPPPQQPQQPQGGQKHEPGKAKAYSNAIIGRLGQNAVDGIFSNRIDVELGVKVFCG